MTVRPTSVIVCTHNRADLLPRVIGQLRAQDYPADAFEIIVVDNCSTDHTPQVVGRFVAEPGVPVHYVAESRLGVTFARNQGAEVARYPYIAYLDDDCSVEPNWLSQLIQGFDLHDEVVAVGGRVVLDWSKAERPGSLLISTIERSIYSPSRLEPELEQWPGANSQLGSKPRVLEKNHKN